MVYVSQCLQMRSIFKIISASSFNMCKTQVAVMKSRNITLRRLSDNAYVEEKPKCMDDTNKINKQIFTNEESKIKEQVEVNMNEETGKTCTLPTIPDNCCGSGCVNCVWIDFANEISSLTIKDKESLKEDISEHLEQIIDPSIKAFVITALKIQD